MTIQLGQDLHDALHMTDEDDREGRIWRVCAYNLERLSLDASAYVATTPYFAIDFLPDVRLPLGHVRVDISLASGCDFIPADQWTVAVEDADGEPMPLVPTTCISPTPVYHSFTCLPDALPGLTLRGVTYRPTSPH